MTLSLKADPVAVIEAAYALERPLDAWLDGVLQGLQTCLGEGLGVWAVLYDVRDTTQLKFEHMVHRDLDPLHAELLRNGAETVDPEQAEKTFALGSCGTLSESLGAAFAEDNIVARAVKDSFGV
ncbi:MAG: hypothetical protein JNK82_25240, partial [Myxococcaceae bacterium]|nr:hypothetical protein [Myxococcaceae bacterium]